MFIEQSMTKKLITGHPEMTILEARELLDKHGIHHLPVVDSNYKLVGMVTDRDIRSALPSIFVDDYDSCDIRNKLAKITLKDIMAKDLVTITPMSTLPDALLLIEKHKFGALPVVDEQGYLKGIISVRDLIRAFINVLSIREPGTLLGILVEDKIGQMKRIVDAITEEKISFGSILVARHWEEGMRAVFPYILTNNTAKVKKKLENIGFKILNPMEWYLDQLPKHE